MELPSNDGVHKLHVVVWQPNGEPKAVLQLSHGMIEFIERYEGLAQYLNEQDILVIGNDHLGHGHTAGSDEDLGYFCPEHMSETVVKDLHTVTEYAKKEYPGIPYFLLGHSMGSFMARRYLIQSINNCISCVACNIKILSIICCGTHALYIFHTICSAHDFISQNTKSVT